MGIVDIALAQEGTKENGTNNVKYNDWYYGRNVSGASYPWCAVFVSWCANQAGVSTDVIKKTASVSTLYSFFRDAGLFKSKGSGYKPKAGDIMIQTSGGASHTGIVYNSDDKKFYTIEGNTSDMVARREYSYSDNKLTGFGTPNYDGSALTGDIDNLPGESLDNTGNGTSSGESLGVGGYSYTTYTVKSGDTIQSIASKFNCTPAMIVFINNLTSTSLKSGQTLNVPTAPEVLSDATSGVGTIVKKHTTKVSVSHPTIEVEFYTEYGMLATVSTTGLTKNTDVDNDVISITTIRNMGQDCPTFSMNLVWRNSWYTNLSPNDLIVIKMKRPPESKRSVFFGLIDDIRKVTDFSSGQPQRAVQVTGRGFNKAFINFEVGLVENLSVEFGQGWMANQLNLVGCGSSDNIQLVLDSFVGKAIKYSFGNGNSFEEHFQYKGIPHSGEILCDSTSYTSYVGSLWNFMKELGNPPFNETYWEIEDEKPSLIHRPTPFNKEDWISLNRTTIQDCEIVSDNTGRSDLETYTLYSVESSLFDDTASNYYLPLWYPPYYAKYGIKQLKVNTVYQLWDDEDVSIDSIKQFFVDLFNFNIKNNVFGNGTIVVQGKASYKIGERVILESENMEYYVESVTQSFNCYGAWTTSLNVTRGIEPENRFTAPWGCAEEFTPQVMNAIINQTSGEEIDWANLPAWTGSSSSPSSTGEGYYDGQLSWPVPASSNITSGFGYRSQPTAGASTNHKGIDIAAALGTPIVAAGSGNVIASGPASGYGNWIKIDHGNGLTTTYGHMKILYVSSGQTVTAGQTIALVGSEGVSTGPHLHFQVEVNGTPVNPLTYFNKSNGTSSSTSGNSSSVEQSCYNFFTGTMGLNKAAACAVLANISAESGFRTGAIGDGGTSYGICQWHAGRYTALKNWCTQNGYDYTTVNGQLNYLQHELQESYSSTLRTLKNTSNTASGAYNSAYYWCVNFEVPANKEQRGKERGNIAKNTFWPKYS